MSFSYNTLSLKIHLFAPDGPFRTVTIPNYYNFSHLHSLILFLFGWIDDHLHRFEVPKPIDLSDPLFAGLQPDSPIYNAMIYMKKDDYYWISNPWSYLQTGDHIERDEKTVKLSFGFKKIGDIVNYEYDFGASWRIQITVENIKKQTILNTKTFKPEIQIIDGEGDTIPEYGQGDGDKYDKNQLNQALKGEFVYYPSEFNHENNKDKNAKKDDVKENQESIMINKNDDDDLKVEEKNLFHKNDKVILKGLKSKPEWNDIVAEIVGPFSDSRQRWPVKLIYDNKIQQALIRTANLELKV